MKEITKIEPTIVNGEVTKIEVFYSEGPTQVFSPIETPVTETPVSEVVPESVVESVPALSETEIEESLKDSPKVTE